SSLCALRIVGPATDIDVRYEVADRCGLVAYNTEIAVHLFAYLSRLTGGIVGRVTLGVRRRSHGKAGQNQAANQSLGQHSGESAVHGHLKRSPGSLRCSGERHPPD